MTVRLIADRVLLGFEVGTGREIYMPVHHLVVTGQTQLSGKTTLLEGLISRSGGRAVAFKTKRGEAGFNAYRLIPSYFKERTGWQYYESILESTLGEKLKFNRPWIMRAAQGAKSLRGVWGNVQRLQEETKSAFSKDQYFVLDEYFKIVVPEIEKYTFSTTLELGEGINVMDLTGMRTETQSLIIQSVINFIHDSMRDVIVVIPEAWKFVPQSLGNPVKHAAATLIREGAAIHNYLWVDSQTITSIDKEILKQCNNWIMGLQIEVNEVNRTKEQTGRRISDRDVMGLKLGHFYAFLAGEIYHVYALPAWLEPELGRRVATGELKVDDVRRYAPQGKGDADEEMWRQRFDEVSRKYDELKTGFDRRLEEIKVEADTRYRDIDEIIDFAAKGLEIKDQVIDSQREELDEKEEKLVVIADAISGLRALLGLEKMTIRVDKVESEKPVERPHVRTPRHRPSAGGTGFPWLDIWIDKLHNPMQEKILRMMADKFPLELTKSDISLATGYSSKGGSFNSALSKLAKWKLLEKRGDTYKLAQGPPG